MGATLRLNLLRLSDAYGVPYTAADPLGASQLACEAKELYDQANKINKNIKKFRPLDRL